MSVMLHANNSCSFLLLYQARRSFRRMCDEVDSQRNGRGPLHEEDLGS